MMPLNQPEDFSPSSTPVYAAGIQPTAAPSPYPKRTPGKRRPVQPYPLSVYPAQPVNLTDIDAPRAPRIDTNFVTHGYHQRQSPTPARSILLQHELSPSPEGRFSYLNGLTLKGLKAFDHIYASQPTSNTLFSKLKQQYYTASTAEQEKLASYLDSSEYTAATKQAPVHLGVLNVSANTIKFMFFCLLWYISSAVTNNIGKHILNHFNFPITLTWVQFGFVATYCFISARVFKITKLQLPTRQVLSTTLPLALFQIFGHICSSIATSMVPVSFVHTIKALSPLFTVLLYRFGFHIHYSNSVYLSLIPLTAGVMLACSSSVSVSNFTGFLCALGSTVIFVTQNVFSKKLLFNEPGSGGTRKLDKINLLFYSSSTAFLLMSPMWLYSDGFSILGEQVYAEVQHPHYGQSVEPAWTVPLHFFLNGTSNFAQNILAFSLLSLTSPVTYSIASLVKRIFVITMAILWFGQRTTLVQGVGIVLTFLGLYMYQTAKQSVDIGEKKVHDRVLHDVSVLPVSMSALADEKIKMREAGVMGAWVGGGQPGFKML